MINRLKEVEVIMKSGSTAYCQQKELSEEKKEVLNELLFRMDAVKTAEDKKYVLMERPQRKKLNEIIDVLPGMKSPTVMPLAQEAGVRCTLCSTNVSGNHCKLKAFWRRRYSGITH